MVVSSSAGNLVLRQGRIGSSHSVGIHIRAKTKTKPGKIVQDRIYGRIIRIGRSPDQQGAMSECL